MKALIDLVCSLRNSALVVLLATSAAVASGPIGHDATAQSAMRQAGNVAAMPTDKPSERFASLGEYLAHLKARSAPVGYNKPYYEEIRPGVYRWVSMVRPKPGEKREFTRQELMEKFGFER